MVQVRYTGPRYMPMIYDVYVNGDRLNGRGYRFGSASGYQIARVSEEEADVLTGVTSPLILDNGTPVNAAVVRGRIQLGQVENETWEVV